MTYNQTKAYIAIVLISAFLGVFLTLKFTEKPSNIYMSDSEQKEFDIMWADMVDEDTTDLDLPSLAGVSIRDSIEFENAAEWATTVDLPEEEPITGDSVCAYISHDTVFIQYYNVNRFPGFEYQKKMFKFIYNY